MPQTKANSKTDLQNTNLNPMAQQAVAGGGRAIITFLFDTGRNPNLPGLIDAIETLYGAGKVTIDKDTTARNMLQLRVAA